MLIQGKKIVSFRPFNRFNYNFVTNFCNFRWVPTLTSDQVADRVVQSIQRKDKIAIIPRYLQIMLCIKW